MNYETHEKREDTNAGLNPAQQDAATIVDGPALVIAGGGTGKTGTLIARLAHLIRSGIGPGIVLLLTFTRRAAAEMIARAARTLGDPSLRGTGGTFHAGRICHAVFVCSGQRKAGGVLRVIGKQVHHPLANPTPHSAHPNFSATG